ncbi:hypothetical protein M758_2G142000 [Ceratodon purpureus]|nr:hypothetical protein M758_2G142000 [Ceratodon purpureus]
MNSGVSARLFYLCVLLLVDDACFRLVPLAASCVGCQMKEWCRTSDTFLRYQRFWRTRWIDLAFVRV